MEVRDPSLSNEECVVTKIVSYQCPVIYMDCPHYMDSVPVCQAATLSIKCGHPTLCIHIYNCVEINTYLNNLANH